MVDPAGAPAAIEDYALIGDCVSAALVSRAGSIDWLCWPRFDSPACFAALLGTPAHGRWLIRPQSAAGRVQRFYHPGTLVLETVFHTAEGSVAVIDFMPVSDPPGSPRPALIRRVEGRSGRVALRFELALRFDYGRTVPWINALGPAALSAIAGPDQVVLRACSDTPRLARLPEAPPPPGGPELCQAIEIEAGETVTFVLAHAASHAPAPPPLDAAAERAATERFWQDWSARCTYRGAFAEPVLRSLITLKALTYAPTGGIVAAPTTSLPEQFGGRRNWDYRYCWLRDATLTLQALMDAGYFAEAQAWRDWLQRSVAGSPEQVQIMYGLAGERRLDEWEASWLPGYQGARPVRIGNAAAEQVQLDIFGEVISALQHARSGGLAAPRSAWSLELALIGQLERIWDQPDEGLWEMRGGRRHFTFSKVMAWVALDRAIRSAERDGLEAPLDRWRALARQIHATVCAQGFDAARGSFVQSFGSSELDASLLRIPLTGFLPAEDPRVRGTLAAIERELMVDGLVRRYRTEARADGLDGEEGAFLACSFWRVEALVRDGRRDEAAAALAHLLLLRNDVGLLAEEYDPKTRRHLGNFPQGFSHLALVRAALAVDGDSDSVTT